MTKNNIHVCIATTAHPIDDVRVYHKFTKSLLENKIKVTWVGPNYSYYTNSGLLDGQIKFIGIPLAKGKYSRFMASIRLYNAIKNNQIFPDIFYAPDPDSIPVAIKLSRISNSKVLFDIHEIYHGSLMDNWLFGYNIKVMRKFMQKIISAYCLKCDLVVAVNESVLRQYDMRDDCAIVVRSCASKKFINNIIPTKKNNCNDQFVIMHGKNHMSRGTHIVLHALSIAKNDCKNIKVIMFKTPNSINDNFFEELINTYGVRENIELRDGIPLDDMSQVLINCNAGVIVYGRGLGTDSLPNRLFEYMAAGLPVIVPEYSTEMAKIIRAEQCGLLVDCENPQELAMAMCKLYKNRELCSAMGKRSRDGFLGKHNWDVEFAPVLSFIKSWFPDR